MRKFIHSNTFLIILSIAVAVLLWVYVVYEVNPIYEMEIDNVVVKAVNVNDGLESQSMQISGDNESLLKNEYKINVRVKGKRNIVSSVDEDDVICTVDMSNVDKAGVYTLKIDTEIKKSGVDFVSSSSSYINIEVENMEFREIPIELRKTGKVPDGYTLTNESYQSSVKIFGADSVVKSVKSAYISLDCSKLTPDDSEKNLRIKFLDKNGNEVDSSLFDNAATESLKVSFDLYTKKEVTVILRPQYKDMKKTNNEGRTVQLSVNGDAHNLKSNGGLEMKVTLEGTKKALEKYVGEEVEVYTEEIDVSGVYYDCILPEKYKAQTLPGDVRYASVPEVEIRAGIVYTEADITSDNSKES